MTCLVCRATSPLGLAVCAECGGTRPEVADRLLFVMQPPRRVERRELRHRLARLVGRAPGSEGVRSVSRGQRALIRLPAAGADRVTSRLAGEGIVAHAALPARAWVSVPFGFWVLLATATASGLLAGRTVLPMLLVLTPVFVLTLAWSAVRGVARPVLQSPAGPSPIKLPRALVHGLAELPPGQARDLLAGVAGAMRSVLQSEGSAAHRELMGQLDALFEAAAGAARDLDGLDRSLAEFVARDSSAPPEGLERALRELQVVRGRLVRYLLEVSGVVGRLQGLSSDGLGSTGERLAELTEELRGGPW